MLMSRNMQRKAAINIMENVQFVDRKRNSTSVITGYRIIVKDISVIILRMNSMQLFIKRKYINEIAWNMAV